MGNSQLESYTVSGHSMYPLLRDGQQVVVQPSKKYQPGDIVVAHHPFQRDLKVIKQIREIRDQKFRLQGINQEESTDNFGLLPATKVIGKVILT